MICAEDELGIGTSHDGIMVLKDDLPAGMPLSDALGIGDTVLLIENQTLTRIGIRSVLEAEGIEIVGEAATGEEGFSMFKRLRPDVTILGLRLPDVCAIDVLGEYLAFDPAARIIVLADTAGDAEISKALRLGASSYVCKDLSPDELLRALKFVMSGKRYIQPEAALALTEAFGKEELTPTETRVLGELAAGRSNKEIALELSVSENTVKTHVKNIFDKLGVSDRTSAVTLALKRGLVRSR